MMSRWYSPMNLAVILALWSMCSIILVTSQTLPNDADEIAPTLKETTNSKGTKRNTKRCTKENKMAIRTVLKKIKKVKFEKSLRNIGDNIVVEELTRDDPIEFEEKDKDLLLYFIISNDRLNWPIFRQIVNKHYVETDQLVDGCMKSNRAFFAVTEEILELKKQFSCKSEHIRVLLYKNKTYRKKSNYALLCKYVMMNYGSEEKLRNWPYPLSNYKKFEM